MGDVASIFEYAEGHKQGPKEASYSRLAALERRLFPTMGQPSFLELLVTDVSEDNSQEPAGYRVVREAGTIFGLLFQQEGFLDFGTHGTERYKEFLFNALCYYECYEPGNMRAKDRIVAVARHLFRYTEGLPNLFNHEAINAARRDFWSRMRYRKRERKAERGLKRFCAEALRQANVYFSSLSSARSSQQGDAGASVVRLDPSRSGRSRS
jgi:hypothetical protein